MPLAGIDWLIIAAYFAVSLAIGLAFSKRAGSSLTEFFVAGRSLPWWIAGTSMVATTFAADTPLAVTGLTIKDGLAGNWVWWAMALGGMVTVFVYARLWHRAGVVTDVELVEMRYGGKPAAFLRGFRALYVSLLINSIVIGWVTGAMMTVLEQTVFHGADVTSNQTQALLIVAMLVVTGFYCVVSGMWGVALTDVVQFVLAMIGCVALAVIAVGHVGGMGALETKVAAATGGTAAMRFLPSFEGGVGALTIDVFLIFLFVSWWASWYPGAEPGGGGYIVQRMASCRSERDSQLAALWFQVAHYCVRPWPWLLVAFVALVMYPDLKTAKDPGAGFPMVIRDLAPTGLRGLLLVTFFAAYMSTISTQVNWGASYLVNDFYKRFLAPQATDKQLAAASRVASVIVLVVGGGVAFAMRDISVDTAWKLMLALGAGTGLVFMLRWFWWRINAWSEIVAMVASLVFFVAFDAVMGGEGQLLAKDEHLLVVVALVTIMCWLAATFATAPEDNSRLLEFYRHVRPTALGWGPIARQAPEVRSPDRLGVSLVCAVLGAGIVYSVLPATGYILFGKWVAATACAAIAVVCAGLLVVLMRSNTARE